MTGPVCPRCGKVATGLRSSVHLWTVLPCLHWVRLVEGRAIRAAAKVKADAA